MAKDDFNGVPPYEPQRESYSDPNNPRFSELTTGQQAAVAGFALACVTLIGGVLYVTKSGALSGSKEQKGGKNNTTEVKTEKDSIE
ncbi:MAG TPA: hypothetical protein VJB60_03855 [Candidatus Peribacterales bacterium]|nr:hypothetical protein [Candidatus Peribacterales bacterium]